MVKKGLGGKGLAVLFGEEDGEDAKYTHCAVTDIIPNKYQPRTQFDDEKLQDLARSIKEQGIIQPLIVSEKDNGHYMLIAGERRLRAAKRAGLQTVPIVISKTEGQNSLLELALIENIQRTDLNAIEEAKAYQNLVENFGYTQERVSQRVGKKRSTIANAIRLLKLPEEIQNDIVSGVLSEGHGRVLVKFISSPLTLEKLREKIKENALSVRQTEKAARALEQPLPEKVNKQDVLPESYVKTLTQKLTTKLRAQISIDQKEGRGKIQIRYQSADELARIVSLLLSE